MADIFWQLLVAGFGIAVVALVLYGLFTPLPFFGKRTDPEEAAKHQ